MRNLVGILRKSSNRDENKLSGESVSILGSVGSDDMPPEDISLIGSGDLIDVKIKNIIMNIKLNMVIIS